MQRKTMPGTGGFSLIEVMVALALGVIVLLGVTQIFATNSQTRAEIERTGRQIESGSYALGLIESDLTNAGFWGEAGEQPAAATLPPVCPGLGADLTAAATELQDVMGYPLQGQAGLTGTCITPKAGSEFLAIRRAASCSLGSAGCAAANANFHLQVNACFEPSDSSKPLPGELLISTVLSDLVYTQRDCATAAPQYRLLSRVYYVKPGTPDPYDDDHEKLMRAELSRASGTSTYVEEIMVEGVETMQFEYGLDTDDDGQVDVHTNSPTTTEWADVAMVRVYLVVHNLEPTAGYTDTRSYTLAGNSYTVPTEYRNHKRQVYARTVSIRNVAGRRESQ